jgi:hypothetical protein
VLNAERAARLAHLVTRQRGDGGRSARAWRAWRTLAEAGDAGDQNAIGAVWQAWLRDPGDELWEALTRWREPGLLADEACRAAIDQRRTADERASIQAFCARRGLAPRDDTQRALFYVLTGQPAEYWAADPDGSRLAAGYQAADEPTRATLRQVMARDSDLDLPHVLAGHQPDRSVVLTAEEGRYLASNLVSRRDWPALWQLARDLPLVQAVEVTRLFSDGWRPADEPGRALFGRLAQADLDSLVRALGALQAPALIHVPMDDTPTHGSFSPDGKHMLVATERGGCYSGCRVYELPLGTITERYDYSGGRPPQTVLHLGEAFFLVGCRGFETWELVRYTAGQPEVIDWNQAPINVAQHPAGFVMDKWLLGGRRLRLCDPRGEVIRDMTVRVADPGPGLHLAAADPRTGRLAIRGTYLWILDSDGISVLGKMRLRESTPPRISFLGPDHVAAVDATGHAVVYGVTGGLRLQVVANLPAVCRDFVPLRDETAVLHSGVVRYLKPEFFDDVRHSRPLAGVRGQALWGSADGRSHALGGRRDGHGFADVVWAGDAAVQELAQRPMAGMGPGDLAGVTAALHAPVPGAQARPFLELLRDCLEYRPAE